MSGSRFARITAISAIHASWAWKNPAFYLYLSLFLPLIIFLPFSILSGPGNSYYAGRGTIVFTVALNTITSVAQDISSARARRSIVVIVTRPVRPIEYLAGVGVANLLYTLPSTVVVLVTVVALSGAPVKDYLFLGVALALTWYASAAVGFLIGTVGPRNERNSIVVANVVTFAHAFLAPVYYPSTVLPESVGFLAEPFFTTHLARVIDFAFARPVVGESPPWGEILILTLFCLGITLVVARKMRLKDA